MYKFITSSAHLSPKNALISLEEKVNSYVQHGYRLLGPAQIIKASDGTLVAYVTIEKEDTPN